MDFSNYWWQAADAPAPAGIGESLRFRGTQRLNRTTGTSTDTSVSTTSFWLKKAALSAHPNDVIGQPIRFGAFPNLSYIDFGEGGTGGFSDNLSVLNYSTVPNGSTYTNALLRDTSAWYHLVLHMNGADVRWYINGELQAVTQNGNNGNNGIYNSSGNALAVGHNLNGYLAEFHFIDGQALQPTEFGEFDANGVWIPKEYTGTYGANGFYLDFSDPAAIGADRSGNGNNFTPTGFELADQTSPNWDHMADDPTQNWATINQLYPGASTNNANLTTANATGKPTVLGIAGNVGVNGASVAWDGTEAGWTSTGNINFGQQPNGFDDFSTAKLPAAPIPNGRDHFRAITDTGANILTAAQTAFPNGLWWIKDRVNSNQHQFVDSVRGGNLAVQTPAAGVQTAYVAPAGNSVAWCWNAGGAAVANNDGSIPSQVAANTDAGFSIVTYDGQNADVTVGHGLTRAPEFIVIKRTNAIDNWLCYHVSTGNDAFLTLNTTRIAASPTLVWNKTTPGNQFFSLGNPSQETNVAGGEYVAYCWHSVPGYSAFGSYTGNNDPDGPFIHTGFRISWLLVKNIDANNDWVILDSARNIVNPVNTVINPSLALGERSDPTFDFDFLSNGFKIRATDQGFNFPNNYIYAAFAEVPQGGSNVAPANAR